MVQFLHPYVTTGKTIAWTRWTFVSKVMSLFFNMLSRFVITFLPGSKCLLISWLQLTLEPKKIKSLTVSTFSPSICHEVMGPEAMILVFWMLSFKPEWSIIINKGTCIQGLSQVAAEWVELSAWPQNLSSVQRHLYGVQSLSHPGGFNTSLPHSSTLGTAPTAETMWGVHIPWMGEWERTLQWPGSSSWINPWLRPLKDRLQHLFFFTPVASTQRRLGVV